MCFWLLLPSIIGPPGGGPFFLMGEISWFTSVDASVAFRFLQGKVASPSLNPPLFSFRLGRVTQVNSHSIVFHCFFIPIVRQGSSPTDRTGCDVCCLFYSDNVFLYLSVYIHESQDKLFSR